MPDKLRHKNITRFISEQMRLALISGLVFISVLFPVARFTNPETTILTALLLGLGTFLLFERMERKNWQNRINKKLQSIQSTLHFTPQNTTQETVQKETAEKPSHPDKAVSEIPAEMRRPKQTPLAFESLVLDAANQPPAQDTKQGSEPANAITTTQIASQTHSIQDPPYPYSDTVVEELLENAIDNNTLNIFVQPTFRLKQKTVAFYELYARLKIRTGFYMPAEQFIETAYKTNLVQAVDLYLLKQALNIIRDNLFDITTDHPIFLNISPWTLNNKEYMNVLLPFLKRNPSLADRIVFDIHHQEINRIHKLQPVIKALRKVGCRFAIDHVNMSTLNMDELQSNAISFLKIPAGTALSHPKMIKTPWIKKLNKEAGARNMTVIVENIEFQNDLRALNEVGATYGQGYLLSKPIPYEQSIRKRIRKAS